MMLRASLAVLLFVASGACAPEQPTTWQDEGSYRWRDVAVPSRGAAGFESMSSRRTGIDFENRLSTETARDHDHLLIGSGVTIGDYDGDGLPDVYFSRLEGGNALYRNLGGWRFEDVTATAGVVADGRYSTGAAFADVDGDGRLDLFVTALGGPNALFHNRGDGTFEDVTDRVGLGSTLGSTSAALADIDGDGDLDLYVAAYKVESAADVLRPYENASVELVVEGPDGPEIVEAFRGHFRIETRDGVEVAVEQADTDRLYLNDGTGAFAAVSWTEGRFLDQDGRPLTRDLDDFGLAVGFFDVDADGDPDLYVCNDFDDPDQLWINDGAGTFTAAAPFALRTTSHASMAVDFADVDRDGHMDFFVADMLSSDPARRLTQVPLHAAIEKPIGAVADRPQVGRNTLFLGRGDGTWAQIAEMAGVDGSEWTWGSVFLDVDLDGFEDLLAVNGHGRDMRDGDAFERISGLRGAMTWREAKSLYPDLPTRNRAFRNNRDLTFSEVAEEWGFASEPDVSHGIALGDLDGDGDLDAVINRLNMPAALLRNEATAGRVAVRLRGDAPNMNGIGARIRLLGGAVATQEKEVRGAGLYLSSSEHLVSFAANSLSDDLVLEVKWPSGRITRVPAGANRVYEIREEGAVATTPGDPTLDQPIFQDVSDLIAHRHSDVAFPDLGRQPLLPYELSRLGPGVTWADVDRDGDPDLVVAAGQAQSRTLLRNDNGRFTSVVGAVTAHDLTTVLPTWGPDGVAFIAGQTSFDSRSPEEARALSGVVRYEPNGHGAPAPLAEPSLSSVGPLAQVDVDGDGDLDVFVGGRSVPAFYPLPATSRLLINDGGEYFEDSVSLFTDLGLVSGAVFTDVDADGDPDLALAIEWGAVRLFLNDAGRFSDVTDAWGLAGSRGLWRGITAGDLNGDGRMDLVATNEGLNTRLKTSNDRPLTLAYADVDQSGTWEIGLSRAREVGGPLFPLARYEQVRSALPAVRGRLDSFQAYSQATLAEVFGVETAQLFQTHVTILAHTAFLNTGSGFDAIPLPTQAQLAPAHHAGVGDLDGDGVEDIVITQNFFPTERFSPRYDAGRGLLLLGRGDGSVAAVPGRVSGLVAYGDQRGAAMADFDGDGRVDLAVAQHGAETKLFKNEGSEPGLRVRLVGPPGNPMGIGATMRVLYAGTAGPAREVHSGAGYWSSDDPVQILGLSGVPRAVEVRWPWGRTVEQAIDSGATEVTVRWNPS
ncbi:MAG: hypothetical protein HN463_12850 [Gemmatimonadales bacterium]|nr:hypothetical protein [Gemmatimonadales bacterium]MBT4914258.1 hypothetical protein [Gemmatimonadales bacterium]MBT5045006.1 hypothetical protein [Gemmatimonadales bacterium]